jgi:DNA polymerase epsilon subunit 2
MKVSLDILRRVYETLQDQGDRTDDQKKDALEPDNHLFFINAYEMPLWHWSQERGTFEKYTSPFFTNRGLN